MNISIISSYDNYPIANELLENFKNIRISRIHPENDKLPRNLIKRRLDSSDIILVIIDEISESKELFNWLLSMALFTERHHPQKTVIPIVIDGCKIPKTIKESFYLPYNTNSKKDLVIIKKYIENIIHRYSPNNVDNIPKTRNSTMIALTVAIELFAALFIVLFYMDTPFSISSSSYDEWIVVLSGIISIFLAVIALFLSYFSFLKRRRREENNEELELYSKRLKEAISSDSVNPKNSAEDEKVEIDALGRMMINLEDIKEFYTWSQKQAKSAFNLARCMCVVGFILIAFAVISPIVLNLSIKASILPTIGGLVTELIAGTALIVYKSSLSQLNHYHKALHEDERFLSSVNLISKFNSPDVQDEMLKEIIRSEIQMNLVSLDLSQLKSDK